MSYTWNSTSGYYEENGQKARIIYLNFNGVAASDKQLDTNVYYNNDSISPAIDPERNKNNAVVMQAGTPKNGSALATDVFDALNASNHSFYNAAGDDVKIVYVSSAPTDGGSYSTIYVGKPDSDKAIVVNKASTFASITEVTGAGADAKFGEGFVLTSNLPETQKVNDWKNASDETKAAVTSEWINVIQRAADRLMGIYTCADGTIDTIEDFQDAAADCHETIYWKKNPADDTDNGHWVAYDSTGAHTKKVIVLDFDGITAADGVTYTNEAMNITAADRYNVTGSSAISDATRIQGIVDALNNDPDNTNICS